MNRRKEKILITGGSGFIGTNLVAELKKNNFDIVNISIDSPKVSVTTLNVDLIQSDLNFIDEYDFDYVVHLAALSNRQMCNDLEKTFLMNVNVPLKLFNKLVGKNIKKIIFMSTVVVYSDDVSSPISEDAQLNIFHNEYSLSKGIAEQVCQYFIERFNLPILMFRLSNIYGPYQSWESFPNLMPQIISQALIDNKIEIWNESPIRDWVYVEDVINAIVKGLSSSYNGIMNLGTGVGTSVGDIVKIVAYATESEVVSLGGDVSGPQNIVCDISRIKKTLGWVPKTSLEEGIRNTIEYYRKVINGN